MDLNTNQKRTNIGSHCQSLQKTEPLNKYFDQISRKNQKVDKLDLKLKPENLFQKTYSIGEEFPKVFQFGTVELVDITNQNKFRVFQDRDLCIQSRYQKKITQQVLYHLQIMNMDEDCQTQQSQIGFALNQNRLDVMKAIYLRERHTGTSQCATDIEKSLFSSKINYNYQSQQPIFESMTSNIVYYSQIRNEMDSEDSSNPSQFQL